MDNVSWIKSSDGLQTVNVVHTIDMQLGLANPGELAICHMSYGEQTLMYLKLIVYWLFLFQSPKPLLLDFSKSSPIPSCPEFKTKIRYLTHTYVLCYFTSKVIILSGYQNSQYPSSINLHNIIKKYHIVSFNVSHNNHLTFIKYFHCFKMLIHLTEYNVQWRAHGALRALNNKTSKFTKANSPY